MSYEVRLDPLEKEIEEAVRAYAISKGIYTRKFVSPAQRSVPDRIFITPRGVVAFVEFKRFGLPATEAQAIELERLRSVHQIAKVIDNKQAGKDLMDDLLAL